jgi:hypothetical protein
MSKSFFPIWFNYLCVTLCRFTCNLASVRARNDSNIIESGQIHSILPVLFHQSFYPTRASKRTNVNELVEGSIIARKRDATPDQ